MQANKSASKSAEDVAKKYGGVAVAEGSAPATTPTSLTPTTPPASVTKAASANPDDVAKKYGGTVEKTFAERLPDFFDKFTLPSGGMTPGPTARQLVDDSARFLGSFKDAAVGTVKGIYNAVTAPPKDDAERMTRVAGPFGLPIKRLLVDPQKAEYDKAVAASESASNRKPGDFAGVTDDLFTGMGHAGAALVPLVGPFAAHMGEQLGEGKVPEALGEAAFAYLSGKALEAVPGLRMPEWKRAINERQISAMGDLINTGVKNKSSYVAAEIAIPLWQQAASELGTTLDQSLTGAFPKRGFTEAGKRAVRTAGEEVVGGPTSPVGIANHAVDIAERPFKDVLGAHGEASTQRPVFGNVKVPQVKQNILDTLESAAKTEDGVNDALAKSIRALKERVVSNGDTFNALNELKVLANKKSAPIFDKNVSGQINATAETAYAWKVLGDSIRSEMYPELSRLSGVDLREAGMREAVAMDARDGVMNKYFKEVEPAQQARMKLNYLEYLRQGSLFRTNLLNRALGLTPAGEFNVTLRRAIGNVPQSPSSVPIYPARNPGLPPTVTGVQHDLIPHDVNAPLLEPPPGTSHAIAQDIFKVQQASDRAARSAPPPTITGQQTSIAENALPDSPFYPGRSGLHVETVVGPDGKPTQVVHDYSQQAQLFSLNQTPYRWNPTMRATSSMQDLSALAGEIENYLKTQNPPPTIRKQWESDLEDVKHEIFRRREAQRTPSSKGK